MSVSSAVDSLGTASVTRIREGAGTLVAGYWQAGATVQDTIAASVQPVNGRDLQVLPDGQRTDELLVFFSTSELRTREPGQWGPDALVYAGATYRVIRAATWTALSGTYYRAIGAKVTPAGSVGTFNVLESGDGVTSTGVV